MVTDPVRVLAIWKEYVVNLSRDHIVCPVGSAPSLRSTMHLPSRFSLSCEHRLNLMVLSVNSGDQWIGRRCILLSVAYAPVSAPGLDDLSTDLLRQAGMAFTLALTQLLSEIWASMVWPTQWNLAHLIPLFKKSGDALECLH